MSSLSTAIEKLKCAAQWYVEPAEHCDVSSIADNLRLTFPKTYHEFLCCAGNGFMPLEGSQYCIEDDHAAMQRRAQSIALKNNLNLPTDAFVFLEHQGYAFNFFLLYDGDDPAVYEPVDGIPQFERVSASFTNWISILVDQYVSDS
jgi:hypothetical protein